MKMTMIKQVLWETDIHVYIMRHKGWLALDPGDHWPGDDNGN